MFLCWTSHDISTTRVATINQPATNMKNGKSIVVVTYGMGVHWAKNAASNLNGRVEVLDLRSLEPIDWDKIIERVKVHGKALVLTEEPLRNSFAESLAGRISQDCFTDLDAPVQTMGAANLPAIPVNSTLEQTMLPNADKVQVRLEELLKW